MARTNEDHALYLSHLYSVPKSEVLAVIERSGQQRATELTKLRAAIANGDVYIPKGVNND